MSRLRAIVLGSAAGGGFPQWNCRGPISSLFWDGDLRVDERTQSSLAVSSDGREWALLNCSPDIRQQIIRTPSLQPEEVPRHSPIKAVLLTNGDIDHVAGLLTLRENQAFRLMATRTVLDVLKENRIFDALNADLVPRVAVEMNKPFPLVGDLTAELFPVPGKVPLYMEDGTPEIGQEGETTVGVRINTGDDVSLFYVPGCAFISPAVREHLKNAPLVLFDGTLWTDDEMVRYGVGQKTGKRMGHISLDGPDGSIAAFADLNVGRKVFVHINNTNPILVHGSPERLKAEAAGWEIAHDGMELVL